MPSTTFLARPFILRSPRTNSTRPLSMWSLMFSSWPLVRSSTTRTAAPRSISPSTRCEPMNEAPPVTSTGRFFQFIGTLLLPLRLGRPGCGLGATQLSLLHDRLVEIFVGARPRLPTVFGLDQLTASAGELPSLLGALEQTHDVRRELLRILGHEVMLAGHAGQPDDRAGVADDRHPHRHRLEHLALEACAVADRADVDLARAHRRAKIGNVRGDLDPRSSGERQHPRVRVGSDQVEAG